MDLSNIEREALRKLAAQVRPLNAYELGDDYLDGICKLARRKLGRRKLVSTRVGRQGFVEYQITDTGRAVLSGEI